MTEFTESNFLPVTDPKAEMPLTEMPLTEMPLTEMPLTEMPLTEMPLTEMPGRISLGLRIVYLVGVIVPFIGLVGAAVSIWGWGFHWVDLGLLLGMYLLTALGITVGYHRLFTHRSFETNGFVQFVLAVLGSMAIQGPLLKWVAMHRRHHQHSDKSEDPHTPHHHGGGFFGVLSGWWHAHLGWIFDPDPPDLLRYVQDLRQSALVRRVSALFPVWVIIGLLLPTLLGGLLTGTWSGAVRGLVWGGLARIFLVHHVTWSVNSVCHLWGHQPYPSNDHSRDNALFGILALGEGWHNAHHAFPTSARHGLQWWQIDVSYLVIRALASLGLAWNIKLPSKQSMARKQRG